MKSMAQSCRKNLRRIRDELAELKEREIMGEEIPPRMLRRKERQFKATAALLRDTSGEIWTS